MGEPSEVAVKEGAQVVHAIFEHRQPVHADDLASAALDALAEQVVAGESDPFRAADTLLGRL